MNPVFSAVMPAIAAAAVSPLLLRHLRQQKIPLHPVFVWLTWVLPFGAGGFFTYMTVPFTGVILWYLLQRLRETRVLHLSGGLNSVAVGVLFAAALLTPLWAADRGMAVFALPRIIPLALLVLLLMQLSPEETQQSLTLLPFTGAAMTAASLCLLMIPELADLVTLNGRLSGFFQYPNAFAAFALAGFTQNSLNPRRRKGDIWIDLLLVLGITLSGSRTAFVLLLFSVVVAAVLGRESRTILRLGITLLTCLGISFLVSQLGLLRDADRFTSISVSSGTFLARLLYFRDALGLILTRPFGLGYWGYRTVLGSIQTGRYAISYVHNGLLQLLLDYGWVPGLLIGAAFVKTIFSKTTSRQSRWTLILLLGHCMLDFDLEFLSIWVVALCAQDFSGSKAYALSLGRRLPTAVGSVVLAFCLWLGLGDGCMQAGLTDHCLGITPFHTGALEASLQTITDAQTLQNTADRILRQAPSSSIGWSASANAALARGDVPSMIACKEQAITAARYSVEEYCDYMDKLYAAYRIYLQSNDPASAAYCREKLLSIPGQMEQVSRSTSPLAQLTGEDSSLELPPAYRQLLALLGTE